VKTLQFIQPIIILNNIIIKNGLKEIELLVTECIHPIIQLIRLRMLMVGFGQPIFQRSDLDQVVLIIFIIFQQVITLNHPMVLMFLKEKVSIHILIIWSSVCQDNFMMVLLILMMVLLHQLLKWLLMLQTSLHICKEELVIGDQINLLEYICS